MLFVVTNMTVFVIYIKIQHIKVEDKYERGKKVKNMKKKYFTKHLRKSPFEAQVIFS